MGFAALVWIAIGLLVSIRENNGLHRVKRSETSQVSQDSEDRRLWTGEPNTYNTEPDDWKGKPLLNEVKQKDAVTYDLGQPQYKVLNPDDKPEIITENDPNYHEDLKRLGHLNTEETAAEIPLNKTSSQKTCHGDREGDVKFIILKSKAKMNLENQPKSNSNNENVLSNERSYIKDESSPSPTINTGFYEQLQWMLARRSQQNPSVPTQNYDFPLYPGPVHQPQPYHQHELPTNQNFGLDPFPHWQGVL